MRENTLIRCSQAYYNNFSHTFCRLCCFSSELCHFDPKLNYFLGKFGPLLVGLLFSLVGLAIFFKKKDLVKVLSKMIAS